LKYHLPGQVKWNFEKFLINSSGIPVKTNSIVK